jgi:hypothetical protein
VLTCREALVNELYLAAPPPQVLVAGVAAS